MISLLFTSGQTSAEFFSPCSWEYLDLGHRVASFSEVCYGLLIKRGLIQFPLKLKLCSTPWPVGFALVGVVLVFWGMALLLWFSGTLGLVKKHPQSIGAQAYTVHALLLTEDSPC